MEPYGYSIFCEDIREEVSGSRSLIGVFDVALFVPQFPVVIPKLAVITRLVLPLDVKIYGFDWTISFPSDEAGKPSFVAKAESEGPFVQEEGADLPLEWKDPDVDKAQRLTQSVVFSPVHIPSPGLIKVRAIVGQAIIKAGVLRVGKMSMPPNETSGKS